MNRPACWLQTSLERVFPRSTPRSHPSLDLHAARGERISFQACVHNPGLSAATVGVSVTSPGLPEARVRRVGYVPIAHLNTDTDPAELDGVGHIPGLVPDPLFPEDTTTLGPLESQAFWITLAIPDGVDPASYGIGVRLAEGSDVIADLSVRLNVSRLVVRPRQGFPATHWFYADALCDWYGCQPFDEAFWRVVEPYMADLVSHGNDYVYVPIFTPPTDGVKRPTQLLKVSTHSPGDYGFDFEDVRRWVQAAQRQGARGFEWTHLFTQWGVRHALRIYRGNQDRESLLWNPETPATSDTYRRFLSQFLPEFHRFLASEGLLDRSIFHLSDEPHGEEHLENYRRARAMLRELAPWMKVSDALSDVRYGLEGLTDNPIPSIAAARAYTEAGIPAWTYFCCGPRGRYLNRLVDTPLAKIRMSGWLFYRHRAKGFLHWGYNYWYKSQTQQMIDPFTELSGRAWPGWAYGDPFVVYPGDGGPIDSIRWEVFAESLQDYALLQSAGIDPDGELLGELKGYDEFPKSPEWPTGVRQSILSAADAR